MYGTIMRARVRPGSKPAFEHWVRGWDERREPPEGHHSTELAWEDEDPDRVVLIVHFHDRASYRKNAESAEQEAEYKEMLGHLEGEPEWIDVEYDHYHGKPLPHEAAKV